MKIKTLPASLLVFSVFCLNTLGQTTSNPTQAAGARVASGASPLVLGHGAGLFTVGPLLVSDEFETLDNWVVQIQQRSGFAPAKVETTLWIACCRDADARFGTSESSRLASPSPTTYSARRQYRTS